MRAGFTGTRTGMSDEQKKALLWLLRKLPLTEFHHGDCLGADMEAHAVVRNFLPGVKIVVHPPDNDSFRAFCLGDSEQKPLPYLKRNKNIVNATDILICAPERDEEELRSGTWATFRYAKKQNKRPYILLR